MRQTRHTPEEIVSKLRQLDVLVAQGTPVDAYAMTQRRAGAAGIRTRTGNHTFRAIGIMAYLNNGGTLEKAAMIAKGLSGNKCMILSRSG